MLCHICFRMLRGQEGRIWKGTYDLHFNHHTKGKDLRRSAEMNCGICRVLWEELEEKLEKHGPSLDVDHRELTVTASLSVLDHPRLKHLYRLDFKIRCDRTRCQRTFVLKRTSPGNPPFRTPISHDTSSDEVYQLASHWMSKCKCAPVDKPPSWYPSRLISLEQLKTQDFLDTRRLVSTGQRLHESIDQTYVKLVETSDWDDGRPNQDVRYVTLSHCWGTNPANQLKLTSKNINKFKMGIKLSDLPKTFRDAVEFASRLPQVGYIWIDSLCIKQGPEEREDWLIQSAQMDKVYTESFLNISATAASSSEQGLFFRRRPELLLEDEVIVNIEGIPGANKETRPIKRPVHDTLTPKSWWFYWLRHFRFVIYLFKFLRSLCAQSGTLLGMTRNIAPSRRKLHLRGASRSGTIGLRRDDSPTGRRETSEVSIDSERKNLRRCTILDVSFWTNYIDRAPVNKRGWVLQERLMAPRVLHFCRKQIAWECAEFDASEGQPQGMPNFQLTSDGIVEESRLKGLSPRTDGKRLRRIRLQGFVDPDAHLVPQIYGFELWRRIVEVYSRTAITNPEDKLIALSGMARWMAPKIGTPAQPPEYVAGLWRKHLASQLLWKVEPVFREIDSVFVHVSTAPKEYRAPSFSWAAIDADKGHGITYAEVTDQDLFIEVDDVSITHRDRANEYGLISSGHIYLRGKLRKATLSQKPKGRFGWNLVDREELDLEEHSNVYLDCLARDSASIFGPEADIFVLPCAKGERTASIESKYIICLILQLVRSHPSGPAFRRVGLTKLSPWADNGAVHKILDVFQSDVAMPHQGYDAKTGMHRILIV